MEAPRGFCCAGNCNPGGRLSLVSRRVDVVLVYRRQWAISFVSDTVHMLARGRLSWMKFQVWVAVGLILRLMLRLMLVSCE